MREIENRRSIRKYQTKAIETRFINQIIRAGIQAPSAKNRQPWKFVVLTQEAKTQFSNLLQSGIVKEEIAPQLLPKSRKYIQGAKNTAKIIEAAPVLILVFSPSGYSLDKEMTKEERIYERADIQSIGASIQNMLLEATSLGIGSLWICDIYFAYYDISKYFSNKGEIIAGITLGYPDECPDPRPRKLFEEVVEYQNLDAKKQLTNFTKGVRTFSMENQNVGILRRIKENIPQNIAKAYGAEVKTELWGPGEAVNNEVESTDRAIRVIKESFGDDAVIMSRPSMGGEDFSRYQKSIPGVFIQ